MYRHTSPASVRVVSGDPPSCARTSTTRPADTRSGAGAGSGRLRLAHNARPTGVPNHTRYLCRLPTRAPSREYSGLPPTTSRPIHTSASWCECRHRRSLRGLRLLLHKPYSENTIRPGPNHAVAAERPSLSFHNTHSADSDNDRFANPFARLLDSDSVKESCINFRLNGRVAH